MDSIQSCDMLKQMDLLAIQSLFTDMRRTNHGQVTSEINGETLLASSFGATERVIRLIYWCISCSVTLCSAVKYHFAADE
ncbi:hypothetical protein TNCV_2581461 [Trichonephila clavipes]|nr:hypothetical protein TNCV_2581461 [Trichonephila clavipes]